MDGTGKVRSWIASKDTQDGESGCAWGGQEKGSGKSWGRNTRWGVLRPLNRAVKLQASGSIRRLNSLAANRVLQTESYNLRAIRSGWKPQRGFRPPQFPPEPHAHELFDSV